MIKNKKAFAQIIPIIWGIAAVLAGLGFAVSKLKPTPPGSTGFMGIPVFGWIIIILFLLILLRKK